MKRFDYKTLDSTNEEAKRLWQAGKIVGLSCVTAACQTAGKGTQGRVWVSPENAGLYFTLIHVRSTPTLTLPPQGGGDNSLLLTPLYTLAAGVACAETLKNELNLSVQLKPVNDLYVDGKKLGGILVESIIEENELKVLFTGIGLNIREVERVLTDPHTSIAPVSLESLLPPHQFERLESGRLLDALAMSVSDWYARLCEDREAVMAAYKTHQLPGTELQNV